jgi:hypothetical protein
MINAKAQKLFGYSEANIKGKAIDFLLPHQGIYLFQKGEGGAKG